MTAPQGQGEYAPQCEGHGHEDVRDGYGRIVRTRCLVDECTPTAEEAESARRYRAATDLGTDADAVRAGRAQLEARHGGHPMTALTLADFLRARLGEDEAKARADLASAWAGHMLGLVGWRDAPVHIYEAAQAHAIREAQDVLADVEAKRRIMDLHRPDPTDDGSVECGFCSFHEQYEGFNDVREEWPCEHLRLLALPYAQHPEYRDEWRP